MAPKFHRRAIVRQRVVTNPFPLSGSGRYLVDANGRPFPIIGESAWGLIVRLTSAQLDAYIADRQSRGFNSVMMMLICKHASIQAGSTANQNGDTPFTGTTLTTPREAYFAWADEVLRRLARAGMVAFLAPCYSGYGGPGTTEGWWDDLTSDVVASDWGAWVGARYKGYQNIVWVGGGDYTPTAGAQSDRSKAVSTGLVTGGANQLQTYHCGRYTYAFEKWGTAESWLKLGNIYTDDGTSDLAIHSAAAQEYARSGPHPFFLVEDWYADEHAMTDTGVIVEKWQALLSGACGVLIGTGTIWPFSAGYSSEFGSNANIGMSRIYNLFAAYPWQTLVPKPDASLVSSALGSTTARICPALGTYSGGNFAMVLVPTATSPTVVMTNFSQSAVRARWYDPVSGAYTTVSGSPFANTGSQSMTHPGNNSIGTSAWVLVLD